MHKPNFNTSGVVGRLASLLISSAAIIHSNFVLAAELQPNPQAEPVNYTAKPADRQIRSIEYHRFPKYHLVMGIDDDPPWSVTLQPNPKGKYPTIIAQSPDNFFPTAELNILPIYDVRIKDLGPDPKTNVFKLLQNMAPQFQLPVSHLKSDRIHPARYGDLNGYRIDAEGAWKGQIDIAFFVANLGKSHGMLILTASTLPGHLDKLEQVMRRSWGNTGVLGE